MNYSKFIFIAASLFCGYFRAYTQEEKTVRCFSSQIHERRYATDSTYRSGYDDSQMRLADVLNKVSTSQMRMPAPPYVIPVVVHVVHNNSTENISNNQIISQITVLNEDFRKMSGTRGNGAGVDTQIEFCLATRDPNGNSTTGITRTVSSTYTDLNINTEDGGLKGLIHWPEDEYLNIYVVRRICDGNGINCGILGYAYFTNAGNIDGVVCAYNYFGSSDKDDGSFVLSAPYDLGRTMTHEVGHWFNLYHTFQSGCTNSDCDAQGDRVCDTPPVSSANFGCPTINSCTSDNNDPSFPFADRNDYVDDYMDYTDDDCMSRYTQGQADRMIAALIANNPNIYSDANLDATGCGTLTNKHISIRSKIIDNKPHISWKSDKYDEYEVHRSTNGFEFVTIATTKENYFNDANAKGGRNYYKVIGHEKESGTTYTSNIVSVDVNGKWDVTLFPNPFNNSVELFVNGLEKGELSIKFYDVLGKEILSVNAINEPSNYNNIHINTSSLRSGIYLVEIRSQNEIVVRRKIIKAD